MLGTTALTKAASPGAVAVRTGFSSAARAGACMRLLGTGVWPCPIPAL